jgi:hypothetical protein
VKKVELRITRENIREKHAWPEGESLLLAFGYRMEKRESHVDIVPPRPNIKNN